MTTKSGKRLRQWEDARASVRGAAHIAQDKPCQDASRTKKGDWYSIACAADGHGSERCPFSGEGAEAAVMVAADLLSEVLDAHKGKSFGVLDAHKEIGLPKQLESRWKERVELLHAEKERPRDANAAFPYELYGTTILALAVTEKFVFAMQLGDGDILAIDGESAPRWLIEPEYEQGGATYSLCMDECWRHVRAKILPLPEFSDSGENGTPLMFMLTTDGYLNSFSETSGFTKAGADIFELWRENGAGYIRGRLEEWLNQSSAAGSGDDITMVLLYGGSAAQYP